MSSLDDVYEQMRVFARCLAEFNAEIRASADELSREHEALSALWTDEAAGRYHQAYEPLADAMQTYLRGDAPRFEQFLETKVAQLERYLYGG